ncbi:MAG: prepilin peptidase [Candidatus Kerfeldbacteria bacterium]|nr:prepilin peptidase [Candidatus Kerfeldbacteria bacterium]
MLLIDRWLLVVLAGALGAAVGSFLNVIILRTRLGESSVRGRSRCPHCGRDLSWLELIPVASFAWLRGRCRHCRKHISWQYPIVEGLTAAAFIGVVLAQPLTLLTLLSWIVASCLLIIAVYDFRWALLPDGFTLSLAIVGLVSALVGGLPPLEVLLGGLAGAGFFGLQYVLSKKRWVGSGDILLGGALGLLLGWRMLGLALFLAYFIGALVASVLLLLKRQHASASIPFGPYLAIGGYLAWVWGTAIMNWYALHVYFY